MPAYKSFSLFLSILAVLFIVPVVFAFPIKPDQLEDRLQDGQFCDYVSCFHLVTFPYTPISAITNLTGYFPPSPSSHRYLQVRFPIPKKTTFKNSILKIDLITSSLDQSLPSGSSLEYSFDQGLTWQGTPIPTSPKPTQLLARFRLFGSPLSTQSGVTGTFNSIQFDPNPAPIDQTPPFVFLVSPKGNALIFDMSPITKVSFYYRIDKKSSWTLINTDTKFPYHADWEKTKKSKEGYQIQATATDIFGNIGYSNILTLK